MEISKNIIEELEKELNDYEKSLYYSNEKDNKTQKDYNRVFEIIGRIQGIRVALYKLGYFCRAYMDEISNVKWKIVEEQR